MNTAKNILAGIAVIAATTGATIMQIIAGDQALSVLNTLVQTLGIDAGMWIACNGAEAAIYTACIATVSACVISGIQNPTAKA